MSRADVSCGVLKEKNQSCGKESIGSLQQAILSDASETMMCRIQEQSTSRV